MATYRIKPEYISQWGEEVTEDTIITGEELKRLADERREPVGSLRKQLIPEEENEVSLDNGRTYMDAAEAIAELRSRSAEYEVPFERLWQNLADMMDDDIREEVHAELAPCTEEEFLERYLELAPANLIFD